MGSFPWKSFLFNFRKMKKACDYLLRLSQADCALWINFRENILYVGGSNPFPLKKYLRMSIFDFCKDICPQVALYALCASHKTLRLRHKIECVNTYKLKFNRNPKIKPLLFNYQISPANEFLLLDFKILIIFMIVKPIMHIVIIIEAVIENITAVI